MSPEIIASLDAIDVNMNKTGMDIINIVLAFVMFGVALGIKPISNGSWQLNFHCLWAPYIVGLTLFSYKCSLKVLGNVD